MSNSNGLWLDKDGKKICYCPWTHFEVSNPNGDVTMCPDNPTILGNINKESILEIWNGKPYRRMRKAMFELGGEKLCSPNCLLLNGMKDNQSFSWYSGLPKDTDAYKNAVLNEAEILSGRESLDSFPRWMKFAISLKCNFRCYHCCQEGDRNIFNGMLSEDFIKEMKKYYQYYQNLFIFGGEPTIFPQFKDILKTSAVNPDLRFGMITNASNIDRYLEEIGAIKWSYFAISLDAASEETYKKLRHPKMWNKVMSNIEALSKLGAEKNFRAHISMTVNSVNCHEIYSFVKFCSNLNAIPEINIVSNVAGVAFQLKYLWFGERQRRMVLNQITAVNKNFGYTPNQTGMVVLERYFNMSPAAFKLKQAREVLKHIIKIALPGPVIKILKKVSTRVRGFFR